MIGAWWFGPVWATTRRRPVAAGLLILVVVASACGAEAPRPLPTDRPLPSRTVTTKPITTPAPRPAGAGQAAFAEVVCPLFLDIVTLDPRMIALRAEGAAGGDVTLQADEIASVTVELARILNALEAAPTWAPGQPMKTELIRALHEVRAAFLFVSGNVERLDAAELLAAVPYISRPSLDRNMARAADAGLSCDGY